MKHFLTVMGAILGAAICAVTGAYVLRSYRTDMGLFIGVGLVLLALAIAIPLQLKSGTMTFKDSVVVVSQAKNALAGGRRSDDPPAPPAAP